MTPTTEQANDRPDRPVHNQYREGHIIWSSDKRLAMQFRTRKEAVGCAKLAHIPVKCAIRIEIMGFYIWALADDHMRYITRAGYDLIREDVRNTQRAGRT
jgi:hypothetical protein